MIASPIARFSLSGIFFTETAFAILAHWFDEKTASGFGEPLRKLAHPRPRLRREVQYLARCHHLGDELRNLFSGSKQQTINGHNIAACNSETGVTKKCFDRQLPKAQFMRRAGVSVAEAMG